MCMTHDNEATVEFRKKNKNKKKVTVWKIYNKINDNSVRHLYAHRYGSHATICRSQELIVSNRIDKDHDLSDYGAEVNRGIHVFTTRQKARKYKIQYLSYNLGSARIFKCTAEMEDLVSVSRFDEAVFMKIRLPKAEFDKGVKGRN